MSDLPRTTPAPPYVRETDSENQLTRVVFTATTGDNTTVDTAALTSANEIILLVQNSDVASAHSITIRSQPDAKGRLAHIEAFPIPANTLYSKRLRSEAWANGDFQLEILTSNAALLVAVLVV